MSDIGFSYKKTSKHIIASGSKSTHHDFMVSLGGKWYEHVNGSGPGWKIPLDKESRIKEYSDSLHAHPRSKYHRAVSESSSTESDLSSDSGSDSDLERPKVKDNIKYYKEFNTKPVDFKKNIDYRDTDDDTDLESSSDESDSSSGESYLSPHSGKRKKRYAEKHVDDYDELLHKVKSLEQKMCKIQIENKKLASKLSLKSS